MTNTSRNQFFCAKWEDAKERLEQVAPSIDLDYAYATNFGNPDKWVDEWDHFQKRFEQAKKELDALLELEKELLMPQKHLPDGVSYIGHGRWLGFSNFIEARKHAEDGCWYFVVDPTERDKDVSFTTISEAAAYLRGYAVAKGEFEEPEVAASNLTQPE